MAPMEAARPSSSSRAAKLAPVLLVWALVAWLVYPLIVLDRVDLLKAKEYFYRSAAGIVLMIILFGKTLFDLMFPQNVSRRKAILDVAFLSVYAIALAGGIIFMLLRILMIFIRQNPASVGIR